MLAATLAAVAVAVGPAPGEAAALDAGSIHYTAAVRGNATVVARAGARARLAGAWGFPRVTFGGAAEGTSRDGRTLVLAARTRGTPTTPSRFALLDPRTLHVRRLLSLPGRFSFDALSPDGSTLYLVEYVRVVGETRYRVRAYDVTAGRLLQRVIADKRSGWTAMAGMPLARASSPDGAWVYTLYGNDRRPFVHALNAAQRYAICVDLPLKPAEVSGLRLRVDGGRIVLVARGGAERGAIDRASLQVLPAP